MRSIKRFVQGACLAGAALAISVGAALGDGRLAAPLGSFSSQARKAVAANAGAAQSMISGYRRSSGLPGVAIHASLMRMAQAHARAMAANDRLDHAIGGRTFQDRIRAAGFRGVAAENIGVGYNSLAEAFAGWRGSSAHSANMLNASVTHMGIAAAYAPGSQRIYWCLVLATAGRRR